MKGMRPLTDNEAHEVQAQLKGRDAALFALGVRTGFRISELLSLKVSDVMSPSGQIAASVEVRRRSVKGKTASRRVVIHAQAQEALASWLKVMREEGYTMAGSLFPSRKGGAISRVQAWRILSDAYARAGLEGRLGTHSMRKTFANRVYDKLGHDLLRTQAALGHRQITSTAAYLSFRESDINAAILSA